MGRAAKRPGSGALPRLTSRPTFALVTEPLSPDPFKDNYDVGAALIEAAEEMVAIELGEREPLVERVYDGMVLVEVRRHSDLAAP